MATIINLIVLTLLGRIQEILPPLGVIKPVLLLMVIGGIVLFVYWPYDEMGRRWRRPTLYWLLASIGFVVSVPLSQYPSKSITFLAMTYLCTAMLFLLVSQCVRRFRTLESVGLGIVFMSLLHGVAMLVNPQQTVAESTIRYSVSDSYDPNDLAVVYAMSFPFLFYWFWRGGLGLKVVSTVAAILAVGGIHWTGSRGGLVALGVVSLYLIFRVREIGPWLRGMLVVGLFLGAALATQTETFRQLVLAVQGKDYNTTDTDGRLQIWNRGIGYAITHPITGVGVMCFEVAEGKLSNRTSVVSGVKWSAAHNSYIQVLAENGFLTFFFWVAMIWTSMVELGRQRKLLEPFGGEREIHRMLVFRGMVFAALLAYAIGGFFLSLGYLPFLYLLVGMTVALAEITDNVYDELAAEELDDVEPPESAEELERDRTIRLRPD